MAASDTTGYQFVSSNVANLDFDGAHEGLKTERQAAMQEISGHINRVLDIDAKEYSIVGAWSDGAENSVLDVIHKSDWDSMVLSAAMKGYLGDQKSVLVFQHREDGEGVLSSFEAKGDLKEIHKGLLEDGIEFHTLVPSATGATVYVADLEGKMLDKVLKGAERHGSEVEVHRGHGQFIGTEKSDGSDRSQRDSARQVFESVINQSPVKNGKAIWEGVRDRWSETLNALHSADAASLLHAHSDPSVQPEQVVASVPGAASAIEAVEKRLATGIPTSAPVEAGGHIQADGTYTEERQAIHEAIIRHVFTDANVSAATPKEGEKPTMTILGGRGGSGKSWFTKSGLVQNAININPDDLQELLPGYEPWKAALYHDEAVDIVSLVDKVARDAGLNVVHDATMRRAEKSEKMVKAYSEAGYNVVGYYMFLPPQTSTKRTFADRAIDRFMNPQNGRYVPPSYLMSSVTNEKTFDHLKPYFDKWAIYENMGKEPKLYAEGGKVAGGKRGIAGKQGGGGSNG